MTHGKSDRQILEEAIDRDFDDIAAHSALADLLIEQGDPRGEYIRVQLELESEALSASERQLLSRTEQALFDNHRERWLCEITKFAHPPGLDLGPRIEIGMRRGRCVRLEIPRLAHSLAEWLRDQPAARSIRELHIGCVLSSVPATSSPDDAESAFVILRQASWLDRIERLTLGTKRPEDQHAPVTHFEVSHVQGFQKKMSSLEELTLFAADMDINQIITLPFLNLRKLTICDYPQLHPIAQIADNPTFHNLTHLMIRTYVTDWESEKLWFGPPSPLSPICTLGWPRELITAFSIYDLGWPSKLPELTHLQLWGSTIGDQGCVWLDRLGIVRQLKHLDLRHGQITKVGARTLMNCPELKQLEWLDLSDNWISPSGVRELKACGIPGLYEPQEATWDRETNDWEK